MSKIKINIVLFGIGNVGSTLINQVLESQKFFLEKKNIELRFPIITNSTLAFFEKDGEINSWETNFSELAIPYSIEDIINYTKRQGLENLIAVDATASSKLVKSYTTLIENDFHIVSANKIANTLSFDFYKELREKLLAYDKHYLYETNVGAGLPIINTVRDLHFSGDKITKIKGVFSGSLSYIFNRFANEEVLFSDILKDAENLGYTEPDSREDLSGNDVARKLLVLAREIELNVEFSDININSLLLPDLNETHSKSEYATSKNLFDEPYRIAKITQIEGHVLRYIGELDVENNKLEVKLVSVPSNSPLGQLKGADSLIEIYSKSYGENPIVIQGAGAGKEVTARGVLTDILRLSEIDTKQLA
jgi:aspartokinase/homoserine dehydrogenase 1